MIKVRVNVLGEQSLQDGNVEYITSVGIDFTGDAKFDVVVVTVKVGVVAGAEHLAVPLGRLGRVVEPMSGVEVLPANDYGTGHGDVLGGLDARTALPPSGRRRRRAVAEAGKVS